MIWWALECAIVATIALLFAALPALSPRLRHAVLVAALVKFTIPPSLFVMHVASRMRSVHAGHLLERAYLTGVAVMLLVTFLQLLRLHRFMAGTTAIHVPALVARFEECAAELSMRRVPRLLVTPRLISPFSVGLLRPAVVIPQSLVDADPETLRVVFAHELMHISRADLWLSHVQALLAIVWWFHPLLHVVSRRMNRLREEACDDAILVHAIADEDGYASVLIQVASRLKPHPFAVPVAPMASCALEARLRRIMSAGVRRAERFPTPLRFAIVAFAIAIAPGYLTSDSSSPSPSPSASSSPSSSPSFSPSSSPSHSPSPSPFSLSH
ncbi:MAG: M56 family metallopeptidase [Acidobacteriota bacterium]